MTKRINSIVAEMQKEVWAMEARALDSHFHQLAELDISSGEGSYNAGPLNSDDTRQNKLRVENGLAVIPIHGVLMKQVPNCYRWCGIKATAYSEITEMINEALGRDDVETLLLDVDSPGGQVPGGIETGNAIYAARQKKKVIAYSNDLACSGAYWLASQAAEFTAGPNAMIGSIGVFCVYVDYSKEAEDMGIKVHVIRSGEHKGMGIVGAKITDKQIEAMQEVIDGMAKNFIAAVVRGRGLSENKVRELATGRVWIAEAAKSVKLIDGIVNQFESSAGSETNTSEENNEGDKDMEIKDITANSLKAENEDVFNEILGEGKTAGKAEAEERFAAVVKLCDGDSALAVECFTDGKDDNEILQAKNAKLQVELKAVKEKAAKAKAGKVKPAGEGDEAADNEFSDNALIEGNASEDGTPEEKQQREQFDSEENKDLRVRLVEQCDGDSKAAFTSYQKLLAAEDGGTVSYAGNDDKK